jgi:hypothetical protein
MNRSNGVCDVSDSGRSRSRWRIESVEGEVEFMDHRVREDEDIEHFG